MEEKPAGPSMFIDIESTESKIAVQQSIVRKILQEKLWTTRIPLDVIHTVSSFIFQNPLTFKSDQSVFIRVKDRNLRKDQVTFCEGIKAQKSPYRNYLSSIEKIKVVNIWEQHQEVQNLDFLMSFGKHLINFFSQLRIGKTKRQPNNFDIHEQEQTPLERSQNQGRHPEENLYWGSKQQPVKLVARNQQLARWSLKELKIYGRNSIISDGVKKGLGHLFQCNILILYRYREGEFWIYFDYGSWAHAPIRSFRDIQPQRQPGMEAEKVDPINIAKFSNRKWVLNSQLGTWKKVKERTIKSRRKSLIMDAMENQYSVNDYFVEKL